MFGFSVAEKEHCYLENEPRGRAGTMGGNSGMDHRRQNRLRQRQKLLVRGPGVTCTNILCKWENLEGSAGL